MIIVYKMKFLDCCVTSKLSILLCMVIWVWRHFMMSMIYFIWDSWTFDWIIKKLDVDCINFRRASFHIAMNNKNGVYKKERRITICNQELESKFRICVWWAERPFLINKILDHHVICWRLPDRGYVWLELSLS